MDVANLRLENWKVDARHLFALGTHFASLEVEVKKLRLSILSADDYSRIRTKFGSLDKLLEDAHLENTLAWLRNKLQEYDEDHTKYRGSDPQKSSGINHTRLYEDINAHFNETELRELSFYLEVSYEDLNGNTKRDKARELVSYCKRSERLLELVTNCEKLCPNVLWIDGQLSYPSIQGDVWRQLQIDLARQIADEVQTQYSLFRFPHLEPPPFPPELEDVHTAFDDSRSYTTLPLEAKIAFQLALNCYACQQFAAAVEMAWRAAEITLGEYYYRMYHLVNSNKATHITNNPHWIEIIECLPQDSDIKLVAINARNAYLQNTRSLKFNLDYQTAWKGIGKAVHYSQEFVNAWHNHSCSLTIEIYYPPDKDMLWALFLLQRYCGGIGRLRLRLDNSPTGIVGGLESFQIGVLSVDGEIVKVSLPRDAPDTIMKAVVNQFMVNISNSRLISERISEALSRLPNGQRWNEDLEDMKQLLGVNPQDTEAVEYVGKMLSYATNQAQGVSGQSLFDQSVLDRLLQNKA